MAKIDQPPSAEAREMWLERARLGTCRICGRKIPRTGKYFCKLDQQYEEGVSR
jgi:hypothetical protein